MRVWKIGSATVAVLGAAALAVGWTPSVSGQQTFTITSDGGQDKKIIVERKVAPSMASARLVGQGGGGHLGVAIRDVVAEDVAKMKLAGPSGAVIDDVAADSPAAKAGALKGDVVVLFDGETVRSVQQFIRLVHETPPGRTVKMAVTRDGKRMDLTVTAGDAVAETLNVSINDAGMKEEVEREIAMVRPDIDIMRNDRFRTMPHAPMMPPPGPGAFQYFENGPGDRAFAFSMGKGRLGVTVQDMTPELAEFFAVKDGVLVSSVAKDTPAAKAGIKAGDVITAIDGATVESSNELVDQLREKNGDVTLALMRDKKAMTIKATLEKQATPKPKVMIRGIAT